MLPIVPPGSRATDREPSPEVRGGRGRSSAARASCRIDDGLLRRSFEQSGSRIETPFGVSVPHPTQQLTMNRIHPRGASRSFPSANQRRSLVRCPRCPSNHAIPATTKTALKIPPTTINQFIGASAPTNIPTRTPPIPHVTPINNDERVNPDNNTLNNVLCEPFLVCRRTRTDDAFSAGLASNNPTLPRSQPALPFRSRQDTVPVRSAPPCHRQPIVRRRSRFLVQPGRDKRLGFRAVRRTGLDGPPLPA